MMTIPESVELKLTRAEEHIGAFNNELEAFSKLNPYGILPQHNDDRTEWVFRAIVNHEPPPKLGVVIGDCVHNLRSSLDHLAFGLAGFPSGRTRGKIAFPLFYTPPDGIDFAGATNKMLAGVNQNAVAIIERLQPYNRGDSPLNFGPPSLAVLRNLSDIDKHRTLHVVWMIGQKVKVFAGNEPTSRLTYGPILEDQAVIARLRFSEPQVYVDVAPTFIIAVQIERPKSTVVPLLPYLRAIHSLISNQIAPELAPFVQ